MDVAATRVEVYDVSCPPGTPASAPVETQMFAPGDFDIVRVTIVIPDGHAGTTGIALAYGHNPILPRNPGAFISGNNEAIPYSLKGYPRGVPWSVFTCNTDLILHGWEVRWEFDDSPQTAVAATAALQPSQIFAASADLTSGA